VKHPNIDLLDLGRFQRDEQHEMFAYLREYDPVSWHDHPTGRGFWNVVRHGDVVEVSRDPLLFSSRVGGINILDVAEMGMDTDLDPRGTMMIYMDPPEHTRVKTLVNSGFTPTALRFVEAYMRDRAALIVDRVIENGGCDFAQDVSAKITLESLGRLIGIPQPDMGMFKKMGDRINVTAASDAVEDAFVAATTLYTYFSELAASRRPNSGDDVVAKFAHAEIDGNRFSEHDFNMFLLMLIGAGLDTPQHALSWGVLALIRHPDQLALLREQPELLPGAVEEILRWGCADQHFRRTATADTDIAGRAIRAGDKVVMWYISANRDEDVFADPYSFSITRTPNDHISFGGRGPHYCLGAGLARIEMRVMLEEVLTRMPDISLAGQPELLASNFTRGIEHMPVRFTPGPRKGPATAN
jgi:cholest-4-en-3-one 26-monooxygenase